MGTIVWSSRRSPWTRDLNPEPHTCTGRRSAATARHWRRLHRQWIVMEGLIEDGWIRGCRVLDTDEADGTRRDGCGALAEVDGVPQNIVDGARRERREHLEAWESSEKSRHWAEFKEEGTIRKRKEERRTETLVMTMRATFWSGPIDCETTLPAASIRLPRSVLCDQSSIPVFLCAPASRLFVALQTMHIGREAKEWRGEETQTRKRNDRKAAMEQYFVLPELCSFRRECVMHCILFRWSSEQIVGTEVIILWRERECSQMPCDVILA